MQKKEISIEGVDPLIFLGVNNANWRQHATGRTG
jgi:hypothetical protein